MRNSRHRATGYRLLYCIPLLLFLASCAQQEREKEYVPEDYAQWERTTDTRLDFPVPGHGSGLRKIYIDPTGQTVEPPEGSDEAWQYPDGTIIVKEIYPSPEPSDGVAPDSLAVMVKSPQDPRSRGGWLWITTEPGSDEERIFTEQFCVTCHSNANEEHPYGDGNPGEEYRDFVYYPYRGEEPVQD